MGSALIIATASLTGVVVLATLALATLLLNLNRGLRRDFEWRFDAIEERFDGNDKHFDGIDKRFDTIGTRLDGLEKRIDAIERRLDPSKRGSA